MTRLVTIRLALGMAVLCLLAACGGAEARSGEAASTSSAVGEIRVAAASDLRLAFEALAPLYTEKTGTDIVFSFGSSGQLREQVVNGAPFDVFASANTDYIDDVIEAGRGDPDTRTDYALGRLVMWSPPGKNVPSGVAELSADRYARIAIANPEHAPYGLAAKQALERAGIYADVESRIIYGENISDTLRIVQSGNADVGLVALSLVVTGSHDYTLVDSALHDPLRQALVVTSRGSGKPAAEAFAEFVASPEGRAVMVRHGFVLPGESLPPADG